MNDFIILHEYIMLTVSPQAYSIHVLFSFLSTENTYKNISCMNDLYTQSKVKRLLIQ